MDLPPTVPPPPGPHPAPRVLPRLWPRQPRLLHLLVFVAIVLFAIPVALVIRDGGGARVRVDRSRLQIVRDRLEVISPTLEGLTDPLGHRGEGRRVLRLDCSIHDGRLLGQPAASVGWRTEPGAANEAAADLLAQIQDSGLTRQDGAYDVRVHTSQQAGGDAVTVEVRVRGAEPCTQER